MKDQLLAKIHDRTAAVAVNGLAPSKALRTRLLGAAIECWNE